MIRNSLIALVFLAVLAPAAPAAKAAGVPAAQSAAVATLPADAKPIKFRGQVVNQTASFITVRNSDPDHLNQIRTFSFSPQLQPKMQRILDAGGYQNGDKVVVKVMPESHVALAIWGRPSKPA